jgi:hypothetical protein
LTTGGSLQSYSMKMYRTQQKQILKDVEDRGAYSREWESWDFNLPMLTAIEHGPFS